MGDEVLFEFRKIGTLVRVTAIHAKTGTEAVIQGPRNTPPSELQRLALSKLNYILNKKASEKT